MAGKNDIEDKLAAARTSLILDKPFLGALVLRLPPVEANAAWCPSTATDARSFYYNPRYIEALSFEQTKFILAHEALHCALSHFARRGHRDRRRWDIACVKPGTLIPGDYERIERIAAGAGAFGRRGERVRVTRTFVRDFDGETIRIAAAYLPPIELTPEHPLLVVPHPGATARWLPAKDAERNQMLVVPKLRPCDDRREFDLAPIVPGRPVRGGDAAGPAGGLVLDHDLAWLLGVYAAAGEEPSDAGIAFRLDAGTARCTRRLAVILASRPGHSAARAGAAGVVPGVPDGPLARAVVRWFGRAAPDKVVPDWLLQHGDPQIVRGFLQGFVDAGAGRYDARRRALTLTMESERLALQLQLLLARFGGLAAWHGAAAARAGGRYRLRVRAPEVLAFLGLPAGRRPLPAIARDAGDHWLVPIRAVTRAPYRGKVHNLETEGHAYLVSNAVVHNCDYAINPLLVADGLQAPPGALAMDSFAGLTAEEIYPCIQENPQEQTLDEHVYDDEHEQGTSRQGTGGSGGPGDQPQVGSGASARGRTGDPSGAAPRPPPLSAAEREALAQQWQQRLAGAAQQARQAGKLGDALARLVEHLLPPRLPWRALLARYLSSSARNDYDFQRPSRREGTAIMPGLRSSQIDLVVALDTSGSITNDEMREFLSEINAIKGQVGARITLHACDERLAAGGPWYYEPWEATDLPPQLPGGGGTSFVPVFDWVARQDRQPDLLLYFTDAEGAFPAREPAYPVIWLVKGKAPVPWGRRIQLN